MTKKNVNTTVKLPQKLAGRNDSIMTRLKSKTLQHYPAVFSQPSIESKHHDNINRKCTLRIILETKGVHKKRNTHTGNKRGA